MVRQEIRLARQEGKSVCPVRGPGVLDLNKLPRWLGHVYDPDLPEQRTALVGKLQRDAEPRRAAMMAPELPEDFVPRPREFDALKERLLDPAGDSIAGITAALRGAGGYGKTTLAKALARDPDIQDAYFDGILWAELGEKPEHLIKNLSDLVTLLSGQRPQLETLSAAAAKLGDTLGDRRILMVIDDAWREQDLRPFLQGGRNCVRLVTTWIDSVLPERALRQKVDAMQTGEALSLLSGGLTEDQVAGEYETLTSLAARLGEWALLLKIVNGFLRNRVKGGESLPIAVGGANKRLDAKGSRLDAADKTQRANAVALTIGISLDLLSASERERFGELGPYHPQTQGKIERWHQTLKNRILLEHYYLPGDLERQVAAFVEHYNHARYHESLGNLTPADVYFGRAKTILLERERIKRQTIANRRLQHHLHAA